VSSESLQPHQSAESTDPRRATYQAPSVEIQALQLITRGGSPGDGDSGATEPQDQPTPGMG